MTAEYYAWMNILAARDTIALTSAGLALAVCLISLVIARHAPGLKFITKIPRYALRNTQYVLPFIILAGSLLRLLNLGEQSLWYDEAFSAITAQRPLANVLAIAANDYHPPAYFLLLWAWSRLWPGQWLSALGCAPLHPLACYASYLVDAIRLPTDAWLRLPSALFGIANIALVYLVGRHYQPKRESLTAAALMALFPFQIAYSQEARMYEMLLTGALITLVGHNSRRWWLVVLGGTLTMYTQTMGAFFLASLGLAALLFDRARLRPLVLSGLGVAALYAPWVIYALVGQLGRMSGGHYWIPQITPGSLAYLWHVLLWHEANPLPVVMPGMVFSFILVGVAGWVGLRYRLLTLLTLAVGPVLLALPPSLLVTSVLLPRTFITVTPALYILIAAGLWHWRGLRRALLWAGLGSMLAVSLWGYYTDETLHKWPERTWAGIIAQNYQPGDAVFYFHQSLTMFWYIPRDIPQYFLPQDETALNAGFNLTNESAAALGLPYLAHPSDLAGRYRRVFAVYGRSPATGKYQEDTFQQLSQTYPEVWRYEMVKERDYLHVFMALFDLNN
jgi:mannosyltransferase